MQLENLKDGHLTYCTNIHPGESWPEVYANLKQHLPPLKSNLSPDAAFGIGLRLSDRASLEIQEGYAFQEFKEWLQQENLYVFTLNGFPYGGFHRQVVKDQVYAPDWRSPDRQAYTARLAQILTHLLPEGIEGSISTLPLSYKPWFSSDSESETAMQQCGMRLLSTIETFVRLERQTGKKIHLGLEPEPQGLLENSPEVIAFFKDCLLSQGGPILARNLGISQTEAEEQILSSVRVCYDTCHFSVAYEDPQQALNRFEAAGIQIGKVQISAALKRKFDGSIEDTQQAAERLAPFAESVYLHQVMERRRNGEFRSFSDLDQALPHIHDTQIEEWRTHFHVPIFLEDFQGLQSTQDDIVTVLKWLQEKNRCQHLEIETYTWDVLPSAMKQDLLSSIQREYEWVLNQF